MQLLSPVLRALRSGLVALWTGTLRVLRGVATLIVALILLFEEWGWRPLAELLARLARFRPWARVEAAIAALPPYPALVVFGLPSLLLLPAKLGALWFLAEGRPFSAAAVLVVAKIVGTALVGRIFMLTKPALMQLSWFARFYNLFIPWKEAVYARVRATWLWRYGRMLKTTVLREAKRVWSRWRSRLKAVAADVRAFMAERTNRLRSAFHRGWRRFWMAMGV